MNYNSKLNSNMKKIIFVIILLFNFYEGYSQYKFSSLNWIVKPEKGRFVYANEDVYFISEKSTNYEDMKVYNLQGLVQNFGKYNTIDGFFDKGMARKRQKGLYGFIDKTGNWLVIPKYKYLSANFDNNGFCIAQGENGKYGVVSRKGEVVFPVQYNRIGSGLNKEEDLFRYNLALITTNSLENGKPTFDIVNTKGAVLCTGIGRNDIIKCKKKGDFLYMDIYKNYFSKSEFIVYDLKNQSVLPYKNWRLTDFNLLYLSKENEKEKAYDTLLTKIDDFLIDRKYGLRAKMEQGKWLIVNKEGEMLNNVKGVEFSLSNADEAARYRSAGLIKLSINGLYGVINNLGNIILPFEFGRIDFDGLFFSVFRNDGIGIYSRDGVRLFSESGKFSSINKVLDSNNLFYKTDLSFSDIKIGLVSIDNSSSIPIIYEKLEKIDKTDLFLAKLGDKYGVITSNNQIVIPFEYTSISQISPGYIVVRPIGGYSPVQRVSGQIEGVIDMKNRREVIPSQYINIEKVPNSDHYVSAVKITGTSGAFKDLDGYECIIDLRDGKEQGKVWTGAVGVNYSLIPNSKLLILNYREQTGVIGLSN